ncbi:MAG: NYN domain-containing protein [Candidatus Staskawiczbacteria bacterium]|nr:NYN domain-containing protein [Candidatus Staskawiczbacteria bacterium]
MKTVLFIDGRNFLDKINSVKKDIDFSVYNFNGLINKVLSSIEIDIKIFYFGKLLEHPNTIKKSKELIDNQRLLKTNLEKQGFKVIIAGRVRGHMEKCIKGHETLTFKEKGVDVKIAVDMIAMACDKELKTAIIGSSDSDLQPAIKELKKRGVERIYLGFENDPNKGLTFTTNRTILIRNSEING